MDSNGDLLVQIVDLLHSKPLSEQAELNKPAVFRVWLMRAFECNKDHFRHLLQIIQTHSGLCITFLDYCAMHYEAEYFQLT